MTILLRFLVGIISAILGAVVVFVLDLATGEGIQFIPVSEFILKIVPIVLRINLIVFNVDSFKGLRVYLYFIFIF